MSTRETRVRRRSSFGRLFVRGKHHGKAILQTLVRDLHDQFVRGAAVGLDDQRPILDTTISKIPAQFLQGYLLIMKKNGGHWRCGDAHDLRVSLGRKGEGRVGKCYRDARLENECIAQSKEKQHQEHHIHQRNEVE